MRDTGYGCDSDEGYHEGNERRVEENMSADNRARRIGNGRRWMEESLREKEGV